MYVHSNTAAVQQVAARLPQPNGYTTAPRCTRSCCARHRSAKRGGFGRRLPYLAWRSSPGGRSISDCCIQYLVLEQQSLLVEEVCAVRGKWSGASGQQTQSSDDVHLTERTSARSVVRQPICGIFWTGKYFPGRIWTKAKSCHFRRERFELEGSGKP